MGLVESNKVSNKALRIAGAILSGLIVACWLWLACREYCVTYFTTNFDKIISNFFFYFRKFLLILFVFILFKLIQRFIIEKVLKGLFARLISQKQEGLLKILRFALWLLFIIIVLSILIGNVGTLFASLGLIGFGLTFALQKPILNFVGWITIVIKGIYSEGDRIRVGSVIGDVVDIQVMNTVLDGIIDDSNVLSGKKVIIPNELVISSDVQNYSSDSNYIVQELQISITYESNYREAISILKRIIGKLILRNKSKYLTKMISNQNEIDEFIKKLMKKKIKIKELQQNHELEKLNEQKQEIESEIEEIEEKFKPEIWVKMLDSSILLIGQYKCPYREVLSYITEINLQFMDEINKRDDISIAYPHMQIVKTDKTKTPKKKDKKITKS